MMYMVISKPNRRSSYSGLDHAMVDASHWVCLVIASCSGLSPFQTSSPVKNLKPFIAFVQYARYRSSSIPVVCVRCANI